MNREAMVEAGARGIHEQLGSIPWEGATDHNRNTVCTYARAVLDAVLPQITNVEQLEALPNKSLLLAVGTGDTFPTFYWWLDGQIRDLDADWEDITLEELIQDWEYVQVVWRPNA